MSNREFTNCIICGAVCEHNNVRCDKCEQGAIGRNCVVCGEINSTQVCSEGCEEQLNNKNRADKEVCVCQHTTTSIFDGNILSVWQSNGDIFFSFAEPAVTIMFEAGDHFDTIINDITNFLGRFVAQKDFEELNS